MYRSWVYPAIPGRQTMDREERSTRSTLSYRISLKTAVFAGAHKEAGLDSVDNFKSRSEMVEAKLIIQRSGGT